jgi:hypothetical protein
MAGAVGAYAERLDNRLLAVSSDNGALIGPDFYLVAALVFVEQIPRLCEGGRIVWQSDELQRDWDFIERKEVEGVHRHLTVSRNMTMV